MMSASIHLTRTEAVVDLTENGLTIGAEFGPHMHIHATPEQYRQIAECILEKLETLDPQYPDAGRLLNAEHEREAAALGGRLVNAHG